MLTSAEHFVMKAVEKLGGLPEIDQAVSLICSYVDRCYYPSKNRRLSLWAPDKGEINELVLAIFTATLVNPSLTYQAISGMIAGRIGLDDHIAQVTCAAECIALVSKTGLIDITHTATGSYIMVATEYELEGIPEPDRHEILMEPPPIYTENYHEDFGSRILGGKQNHHDGDICLDHINRVNSICYSLNKPFLSKYEEAPTYALDTREKREQWEHFVRTSYRKYIEVAQKGNRFYLNHNDDKRGRCYAEGYHINTQGSSFKKAMIMLADAEIVEE